MSEHIWGESRGSMTIGGWRDWKGVGHTIEQHEVRICSVCGHSKLYAETHNITCRPPMSDSPVDLGVIVQSKEKESSDSYLLSHGGVAGTSEWSEEDKCYHGKIAGILDLVTFKGKDYEELKEEFVMAVDDWHETRTAL